MTLFLVSNTLILVDQYTKFLVNTHIPLYYSIKVIDDFFNLTHVRNPGVAFGLFADQDSEYKVLVFILVSTVAIFAILFIYYQTPDEKKMVRTGLILIFSGAIGNLIDRIAYAEVIDFVDIFFGNYHWPAFNFADACITIGVWFMIIDLFQGHPEEKDPPLFKGGQGGL